MRLGATVNGSVQLEVRRQMIAIPASALTEFNRQPAVWIVDPSESDRGDAKYRGAALRPGDASSSSHGLETGDIVVTAGVQALHPGQKVRLLGPSV